MKRQMGWVPIASAFSYSRSQLAYLLNGGDFMKDTSLTITEHHPQYAVSPNQAIRQTITTWLTKALHK